MSLFVFVKLEREKILFYTECHDNRLGIEKNVLPVTQKTYM